MEFNYLKLSKEDKIAIITISRPKALNALNSELLLELDKIVDLVENDKQVNVIILTGEGKSFVAGADIAQMKDLNFMEGKEFSKLGNKVFRKLELLQKPVIAAVNGFALGGGCELAMACDIRYASKKAKFGQPEVGLGITPGFGGTQRLSRLVGLGKAKELIYTAKIIKADEAKEINLVEEVFEPEELMQKCMELAKSISKNAQIAVNATKEAINRGFETDIETGLSIEADLFGLCFASLDQKEGMDAFLNKRNPNFKKE
ncbi:MAG: short-chain-enoyl-CoA hydratase [Peptostreptococcaceae bacterium]|jgi:enoyl-CoA hydratase|nr:short-chain-enoyl-CoA hydratase [Peptostreptococcaceae bacterium]